MSAGAVLPPTRALQIAGRRWSFLLSLLVLGSGPVVAQSFAVDGSGNVEATAFVGDGSGLTDVRTSSPARTCPRAWTRT
jgi:hypothetical protein